VHHTSAFSHVTLLVINRLVTLWQHQSVDHEPGAELEEVRAGGTGLGGMAGPEGREGTT
jgi:hypothetical protein